MDVAEREMAYGDSDLGWFRDTRGPLLGLRRFAYCSCLAEFV